jgi:prevent-host-death family protein
MMGTTVNIHEAKTHLSKLLERVQNGEEITIAKAGKPIATLTAIHPQFDDPLPEWDPDYMHPEDPMRELLG